MGFLEILTLIGCLLFFLLPILPGYFLSKTGVKESSLRAACPRCGKQLPYGTTRCPKCKRNIHTSDVIGQSGYWRKGLSLNWMRFLIGYAIGIVLEAALLLWIL